jgi:hypothetical protein
MDMCGVDADAPRLLLVEGDVGPTRDSVSSRVTVRALEYFALGLFWFLSWWLLLLGCKVVAVWHRPRLRTGAWIPGPPPDGALASELQKDLNRGQLGGLTIGVGSFVPVIIGMQVGEWGGVVGLLIGLVVGILLCMHAPNTLGPRAARILGERMRPDPGAAFVGLLRTELYRTMSGFRVDNLGLLVLARDELEFHFLEGKVSIPREAITRLELIPFANTIGGRWLQIDFVNPTGDHRSVLVVRMDAARLDHARTLTSELRVSVVQWLGQRPAESP